MSVLSKRLKEARNRAGYKQIEAAKKIGISNGTLSGYERDYRDPDTETLEKMAEVYDVSVDWLLGRSEGKRSEKKFDPLEELRNFMVENNMQDMDLGFYDIEKWKKLTPEDVEEVKRHFRWVVQRAEEREREK